MPVTSGLELTTFSPPLAVLSAGVLSPLGRGLQAQLPRSATTDLAPTPHEGACRLEVTTDVAPRGHYVTDLEHHEDPASARQRKLMSRSARLLAVALHDALRAAELSPPYTDYGAFFGVGSSGGALPDLTALVRRSIDDHGFSMKRLGEAGLYACSPLFSFQIMNNFTLCHSAIREGLGGPSELFFSRGGGTAQALQAAAWSLQAGECSLCIVGAADTAHYEMTDGELRRGGVMNAGVVPSEGAAALILTTQARATTQGKPLALLTSCAHFPCGDVCTDLDGTVLDAAPQATIVALTAALARAPRPDVIVCALWSQALRSWLASQQPTQTLIIDAHVVLGEALAATPALAWCLALSLLDSRHASSARVICCGLDGAVGVTEFQRGST